MKYKIILLYFVCINTLVLLLYFILEISSSMVLFFKYNSDSPKKDLPFSSIKGIEYNGYDIFLVIKQIIGRMIIIIIVLIFHLVKVILIFIEYREKKIRLCTS